MTTETFLGAEVRETPAEPMRVLSGSVIDMTDRKPEPARRKRGPKGTADADHARVLVLVEGGMSALNAIKQVAAETGKTKSSIQANYYTVRKRQELAKPPAPRATQAPATTATRSTGGASLETLLADLTAATNLLATQARAQHEELVAGRARLQAVRDLVS